MDLQLKKIRNLRGLSQDEMAQALGIKTSRYGTWERGERAMSFSQAIACSEILGCSLDELAGRKPPGESNGCDPTLKRITENFESMNSTGRERLAEQAEMMASSELFAKSEDNQVQRTA